MRDYGVDGRWEICWGLGLGRLGELGGLDLGFGI